MERIVQSLKSEYKRIIIVILLGFLITTTILTLYYTRKPDKISYEKTLYNYTYTVKYECIAVLKPNLLYNKTLVKVGEAPLYIPLLTLLNTTLKYGVERADLLSTTVNTTIYLENPGEWAKLLEELPLEKHNGSKISSTDIMLNVSRVKELIEAISSEIGVKASEYNVRISPNIKLRVRVDNRVIEETLTPELKLVLDYTSNQLRVEGLEYRVPRVKKVVYSEWIEEEILGVKTRIIDIKKALYLLLPILSIALSSLYLKWSMPGIKPSFYEVITRKYKSIIVEVAKMPQYKREVKVNKFEDLVKISLNVGKPILAYRDSVSSRFFILSDNIAYVFEE